MRKEKRLVLNKKGMYIYGLFFIITIVSGVYDTQNMDAFIISKIITTISMIALLVLSKYIPSKYL